MSKIHDDDRRLYQCARKYDQIVNQLVEMMTARARPPKRRRISSSSSKETNKAAVAEISPCEDDNDGKVFVETITKFLQELSDDQPAAETDSSSASRDSPE